MELSQEQVVLLMIGLGFRKDLDQWKTFGWIRFELHPTLDEKDLRLIWYKEKTNEENLREAGNIIFKAGQKFNMLKLTTIYTMPMG